MTTHERPILFSGPLVRAILAGTKTVTRRPVTPPLAADTHSPFLGADGVWRWMTGKVSYADDERRCPHGGPRDRLWAKETFTLTQHGKPVYRADFRDRDGHHWPSIAEDPDGVRWRPSIHMPRRASRILLEVTDVRVERLQSITEEDAKAEGVEPLFVVASPDTPHRNAFRATWDEIYGEGSWAANGWVWRIGFKRIEEVRRG